jgi:TonB family protein
MENKGFPVLVVVSVVFHAVVLFGWTAPVFTPPVVELVGGEMSVALAFIPGRVELEEEPVEEPVEIVEEPVELPVKEIVEKPTEEPVKEPVDEVVEEPVVPVPAVVDESEPVEVQPAVATVASVGVRIDPRPRELMNRPPVYPSQLGRRLHNESVLLEVEVLSDGSVGGVRVEKGCRYSAANKAVLKAVRKWKYHPAKLDGVPVRVLHKERFVFEYRPERRGSFARD